ncbi:suppressor for copper-sensitivity B [Pseudovibrio denitrificans]|uniref:Suppressor for copper-sensitivity B n=1 Tax=Pseudovibrio denitrificans TaxID=258256 RepID=A0A1I6YKL6_9HYPH|nr:protein-disulfide reductase DsbD domain-containing protein [Pseudovibrio denitrificans]SFT50907.1 suppressor for copper-sensitivity B [Pseudovibrio denitrificans]
MLKFGHLIKAVIAAGLTIFVAHAAQAATSETVTKPAIKARLLTVQDGIAADTATLSAGVQLQLDKGWKTYWRSPGEVGTPPQFDWSTSENVANVRLEWPAPLRFTAFGIENFGYHGEVVFPLQIDLKEPGEPVSLSAQVSVLVCSDICVPQTLSLSLKLPKGSGLDRQSGELIAAFSRKVPLEDKQAGVETAKAYIDDKRTELIVDVTVEKPLNTPDIFPELGHGTALGKPDVRVSEAGRRVWARFPVLSFNEETFDRPRLTVTDGPERAFAVVPNVVATALVPPFSIEALAPGLNEMIWITILAFLGGLILNVMPCVLPVISIKLSSALKLGNQSTAQVRRGFLASALGVMAFVWGLALVLFVLQRMGIAVGWGLQFQNPIFLAGIIAVLIVFAGNLFGAFEIMLPADLQNWLSKKGEGTGYKADFLTGVFGAVLATPCSAPLLGTAVAFALAGGPIDIMLVFTSLGIGLATPYLIVAARPQLVKHLPKPGRWMLLLKLLLAVMLSGTVLWLLWIMFSLVGSLATVTVLVLALFLLVLLSSRGGALRLRILGSGLIVSLVLITPVALVQVPEATATSSSEIGWVEFDRGRIAQLVSQGQAVFVDVTAEWCLTCKANKALVLGREPVLSVLTADDVTAMRADWTRPDESISRYLSSFNRFGIPFNVVYGPNAPDGIVLSELLTSAQVIDALTTAGKTSSLSTRKQTAQ